MILNTNRRWKILPFSAGRFLSTTRSQEKHNNESVKYASSRRKFVDRARVSLIGGKGGLGCTSFQHLGPGKKKANGGDAGKGGDVIIRTNQNLRSLNFSSHHYRAKDGGNGSSAKQTGKNGKNVYIDVPVGTVVNEINRTYDEEGMILETKTNKVDMDTHGMEYVGAKGGTGGRGNHRMIFSESAARRYFKEKRIREENNRKVQHEKLESALAELENEGSHADGKIVANPENLYLSYNEDGVEVFSPFSLYSRDGESIDYELMTEDVLSESLPQPNIGEYGEERFYELELKLIADVGLVGYPNAGKSTLLGTVSKARPKVASYPFTTLHPFVGMVEFDNGSRYSIADIPGLIDGAHDNVGLGHSFLRHIERSRVHAYVIDISDKFNPSAGSIFESLRRELNLYEDGLGDKDSVIVANKIDNFEDEDLDSLLFQEEQFQSLVNAAGGREIFPVSANTGDGLQALLLYLHQRVLKSAS